MIVSFDKNHTDVTGKFTVGMNVNPLMPKHAQDLLFEILVRITDKTIHKFERGQVEHGGNLLERNLIKDISDEAIDQNIYITAEQIKRNEC